MAVSSASDSDASPLPAGPFILRHTADLCSSSSVVISDGSLHWLALAVSQSAFRHEPRGVGTTGSLAPARLKPRGRECLFARAIFTHIFARCSLNFHSLSSTMIQKDIATENFNKQKNAQAYPTRKACLCHKQHGGKLLRVL